jgi:hypothetical protein
MVSFFYVFCKILWGMKLHLYNQGLEETRYNNSQKTSTVYETSDFFHKFSKFL